MVQFGQNIEKRRADALARLEALVQSVEAVEVPSAARALIYERKVQEAKECIAGVSGPFPLVEADARVDSVSMEVAAQAVLAESTRMAAMAAALEEYRRGIKVALVDATTVAEVDAAAAEISPAALWLIAAISQETA